MTYYRRQTRLPAEPLRAAVEHYGGTDVAALTIAERLGCSPETAQRQLVRCYADGVTVYAADRLAVGLGLHPMTLWPTFNAEPVFVDDQEGVEA